MQPGATIKPGDQNPTGNRPPADPQPRPTPQSPPDQAPTVEDEPIQEAPQLPVDPSPQTLPPVQPVSWTASEYIARHKNTGWFLAAGLAIIVVAAGIFLITRDVVSTIVIGIVGLSFAVFAGRPPHVLEYSVDNRGVHIGPRFYSYDQFRSFSVFEEDAVRSILFMPTRRFGLPLTIHYDPADEEKIVNVLGGHLPLEERNVPAVDRFMTKIHF